LDGNRSRFAVPSHDGPYDPADYTEKYDTNQDLPNAAFLLRKIFRDIGQSQSRIIERERRLAAWTGSRIVGYLRATVWTQHPKIPPAFEGEPSVPGPKLSIEHSIDPFTV